MDNGYFRGLKNSKVLQGIKLLIPIPFDFITLKRRYLFLFEIIINVRYFFFFYRSLPHNAYFEKIKSSPLVIYKYFGNSISLGFSVYDKIKIYKFHYDVMIKRLEEIHLSSIGISSVQLWHKKVESDIHEIILFSTSSLNSELEGALTMAYLFNGTTLFKLIFTHIPGNIIEGLQKDGVFVGCSQGTTGNRELWKLATKQNLRLSPDDILLLALQAWAIKNNAQSIVGVNAENQVSEEVIVGGPSKHLRTYQTFWMHNSGERVGDYFLLPIEPVLKEKKDRNNYSSRDKKIHAMRIEIYNQIQQNLVGVIRAIIHV